MRIILLGAPGSGKGTQGDFLARKYGFPKISSGDLLRKAVKDKSPIGNEVEQIMKKGELVNDNLIINLIMQRVEQSDCRRGYTLDGFPRTAPQARLFDDACPDSSEIAIEIFIDDSVVIERLTSRLTCSRCGNIYNLMVHSPEKKGFCDSCGGSLEVRSDDQIKVIKERLKVYHAQRDDLVKYYQNKNAYECVDGHAEAAVVFDRICSLLDKKIALPNGAETVQ